MYCKQFMYKNWVSTSVSLVSFILYFESEDLDHIQIMITRKYPLRGYILVVLTHKTAWDRLWGGDLFLRSYIRKARSDWASVTLTMWF